MSQIDRRVLVSELPGEAGCLLPSHESKHLRRVLRLREGDTVEVLDGAGRSVRARLRFQGASTFLHSISSMSERDSGVVPIELGVGLLKRTAFEWVIQKAVELGVETIQPISCEHSVKVGENPNRWRTIADQALKQCGRKTRLKIPPVTSFQTWTQFHRDRTYYCDEKRDGAPFLNRLHSIPQQRLRIFVGPEGGISEAERQEIKDSQRVSLGPYVLRAESAAIHAASIATSWYRSLDKPDA